MSKGVCAGFWLAKVKMFGRETGVDFFRIERSEFPSCAVAAGGQDASRFGLGRTGSPWKRWCKVSGREEARALISCDRRCVDLGIDSLAMPPKKTPEELHALSRSKRSFKEVNWVSRITLPHRSTNSPALTRLVRETGDQEARL